MKPSIQSRSPIQVSINGHPLVCSCWEAEMVDPMTTPYFGLGFRQDIRNEFEGELETETKITLTFRGADSIKFRAAIQAGPEKQAQWNKRWDGNRGSSQTLSKSERS